MVVLSMKVWMVIGKKGGIGKTTLSLNLAVASVLSGMKTLTIELDSQKSLSYWWETRENDGPHHIQCSAHQLSEELAKAVQHGFELVIIDTPGYESAELTPMIKFSTICLVPCQPSLDDCRSVSDTIQVIKKLHKPFVIIASRCPATGNDFQEFNTGMSTLGIVCPTPTIERKGYKRAYAIGLGVMEYESDKKAASEINSIFQWVKKKEQRLMGMDEPRQVHMGEVTT